VGLSKKLNSIITVVVYLLRCFLFVAPTYNLASLGNIVDHLDINVIIRKWSRLHFEQWRPIVQLELHYYHHTIETQPMLSH
jgi:hypothetical protein